MIMGVELISCLVTGNKNSEFGNWSFVCPFGSLGGCDTHKLVQSRVHLSYSAKGPLGWYGCVLLQQQYITKMEIPDEVLPLILMVEGWEILCRPFLPESPHNALA